jgi:hypothetical protein
MVNMNKRQRDLVYPHVLARQGGEFCVGCGRDPSSLKRDGHKPEFCIDCVDNSGDHSRIENLQLLCHSCNTKKNHPDTDIPFHRTPTPEMVLGKRYESDFRRWIAGQFMENSNIGLEYDFAVSSGAEKVGCSPETIKRYLKKMTSSEGMYTWEDRYGSVLLVLKPEFR